MGITDSELVDHIVERLPFGVRDDFDGFVKVGIGQHRESSTLERCNFEVAFEEIEKTLANSIYDEVVQIRRARNWAVGWHEDIYVRVFNPGFLEYVFRGLANINDAEYEHFTEAFIEAMELVDSLEQYPILSEERYSEMEYEESFSWISSEITLPVKDDGDATAAVWQYIADTTGEYPSPDVNLPSWDEIHKAILATGWHDVSTPDNLEEWKEFVEDNNIEGVLL